MNEEKFESITEGQSLWIFPIIDDPDDGMVYLYGLGG